MTLAEQIQKYVNQLPPEKQSEVLDFVAFLQKRATASQPARKHLCASTPLSAHGVTVKSMRLLRASPAPETGSHP